MLADWNDAFKTNIDIIDQQHKELFRLLRDLEQMLLTQCMQYEYKDFFNILLQVRDYVTYHFYTEEQYMEKIKYPELASHKVSHEKFRLEISKINYDELKKDSCKVIKNVGVLIEDFIMNHILIEDMKMSKYKELREEEINQIE